MRRERFGGPPKGRWGKDRGDVERKTACTLRKGQKRWKNWGKETGVLRSEERSEFMGFGPAGEFKSTRWEANETHPESRRMCRSGRPHYRICRHLHACCRAPSTFWGWKEVRDHPHGGPEPAEKTQRSQTVQGHPGWSRNSPTPPAVFPLSLVYKGQLCFRAIHMVLWDSATPHEG